MKIPLHKFIYCLAALLAVTGPLAAQGLPVPDAPPGPLFRSLAQIRPGTALPNLDPEQAELHQPPLRLTQPGHYYLTQDLITAQAGAPVITVEVPGVVLDLNGYAIIAQPYYQGKPLEFYTGTTGRLIDVADGADGFTLLNGRLQNKFGSGPANTFHYPTAINAANANRISLIGVKVSGFLMTLIAGGSSLIDDCHFEGFNRGFGNVSLGNRSQIRSTLMIDGRFDLGADCLIEDTIVSTDDLSIYTYGSPVPAVSTSGAVTIRNCIFNNHLEDPADAEQTAFLGLAVVATVESESGEFFQAPIEIEGSVVGYIQGKSNLRHVLASSVSASGGSRQMLACAVIPEVNSQMVFGEDTALRWTVESFQVRQSLLLGNIAPASGIDIADSLVVGGIDDHGSPDFRPTNPGKVSGCLLAPLADNPEIGYQRYVVYGDFTVSRSLLAYGQEGVYARDVLDCMIGRLMENGARGVRSTRHARNNALFGGRIYNNGGEFIEITGNSILSDWPDFPSIYMDIYYNDRSSAYSINNRTTGPWFVTGNFVGGNADPFFTPYSYAPDGKVVNLNRGVLSAFVTGNGMVAAPATANFNTP